MVDKVDFKKTLKHLYQPDAKSAVIVDVPPMQFLMIDGKGSPGESKAYLDALAVLYPVAFKVKFLSKEEGRDYVVPPLEGLWWADNMNDFKAGNRDNWRWTLMIMQPIWILPEMIQRSIDITREKKPDLPSLFSEIRFGSYSEGKAAQIMHLGPYSSEPATIELIHEFIKAHDGIFDGLHQKHHEIYLTDPRKSKPEKMRTVIRQPFKLTK